MDKINITFKFNNDAVEEPMNYLGGGLQNKSINLQGSWIILGCDYLKLVVTNVEESCRITLWLLPTKSYTPIPS